MPRTARPRRRTALAALSTCLVLGCGAGATPQGAEEARPPAAPAEPGDGVVTWASSADRFGEAVDGRGYRMVVHTSVGGSGLRVRLSNAFGDQPVTFGNVHAGLQRQGAALVPGSNRRLTFDGARSVTVPPGGIVHSDPLPGHVPAASSLAVSLYVARAGGALTGHWLAMQTSYTTRGDHTAEESAAHWKQRTRSRFYLDAVTVRPRPAAGAVVALGDSVTDGWQSTTDLNRRWPDYLARRLATSPTTSVKGVANAGIAGNRVLTDGAGQSALNRLSRDALSLPGVRTVFLFQGVNDIKFEPGVTAAQLIAGYRTLIDRVHGDGKCVVGATIAPFKGWQEWDPAGEAVRRKVNAFIRTSGEFDAVADFDRVLRSPDDPESILPAYDGGDHLHPNDKGMRAMADAVDLESLDCGSR
ncbi:MULTISPECIES: SGNH/GDSL hydrolase family protein [Streptomyces]|uniref:SGNH/GDSL hydrolase family protein n=1 Tax=Streptomyces koelreuteriae TaxID=2838015 RepID=A0ABX8G3V7_9ACTN|nr:MULTISPECIES: SGNH/GDSL hydrolase family protein [Streptomyces]QWB27892.1 SGNH/GDSL hydrolase family protein [Streptomyces koelreuteriae]UUA10998.1 SGNH/GDSL hydrolase family protein [Streptomyces koelreuteriae]UUA18604.1 SGNH/GDSL hydrolase family protein [Streptomyces sp. CRCS-T-1]